MKRLTLAAALGCAAFLSGCEDPADTRTETAVPPVETAPVVEPAPVEEAAPPQTPSDHSTLPPDARRSEETVKPESETLFY